LSGHTIRNDLDPLFLDSGCDTSATYTATEGEDEISGKGRLHSPGRIYSYRFVPADCEQLTCIFANKIKKGRMRRPTSLSELRVEASERWQSSTF